MGADDYLISPIDLRELMARIRTILRRRSLARHLIEGAFTRLRFGAWDLDDATRLLRQDGQAPVRLTRREFDLLSAFLRAPRKVLSREDLLRVTGAPGDLFDRAIDTQIRRLRGKLRSGRQGRAVIETVRGVGYAFQAEVEPA